MPEVVPVILCGGAGTRLWPLSRELYPKQLLSLLDDQSLLQNTVSRMSLQLGEDVKVGAPLLICNENHRFLVAEQLLELGITPRGIILEPMGKNTAPAVAIAALKLAAEDPDLILVVLPSDHAIDDTEDFLAALNKAISLALQRYLVTFGVTPDRAETGYGYIEKGNALEHGFAVKQFVEKPDAATASIYVDSGDYVWNSGMFVFTAWRVLEEIERHRPVIMECCQAAVATASADLDFIRISKDVFEACPSESIDYAVMENAERIAVVPLQKGWTDLGSWALLWDVKAKTTAGNVVHGDVIVHDVNNSLIHAEHRLVAAAGLEDVVIVETADAVMVTSRESTQDVKHLVDHLRLQDREEHLSHRKVHRPWGHYEGLDIGLGYQVKRLFIKPGASISLQLHHQRAEHWVVVQGTARVTRADEVFDLQTNESTYIPKETRHRLENPTDSVLEIIEVQSGNYLGEDDIVRFEDAYGR